MLFGGALPPPELPPGVEMPPAGADDQCVGAAGFDVASECDRTSGVEEQA
jgi:hypothetical protein